MFPLVPDTGVILAAETGTHLKDLFRRQKWIPARAHRR